MVFIGVDIDQIDKMAPRGVKSAPGAIELNRHFGAETDLLNLQCTLLVNSGWLDFTNFKVFVEFSADKHGLNGGLDF